MAEKKLLPGSSGARIWILTIVIILFLIGAFSDWIMELLWLDQLGYEQVFWTIKKTQILLLGIALVVSLLYVIPNMRVLAKQLRTYQFGPSPLEQLNLQDMELSKVRGFFTAIGTFLSVLFSLAFFMRWDTYFRFHWDEVFGKVDPIFGNDIGFYLFRLPFIELVQDSLITLVFFVTAGMAILYLYAGALSLKGNRNITMADGVRKQLSLNLGFWLLLLSWGYYLERYNLLNNERGIVYGASYVNLHVSLPVLWILFGICLVLAGIAFYSVYRNRIRWLIGGGLVALVVGIVGQILLPGALQSFVVEPNELVTEEPYLENNIEMTRQAYDLDSIKERSYQARDTMTWDEVQNNRETLNNIRLWDPRMLIQTYRQLQEIRLYYQFYNVDVDRYQTDEGYMQMMLSARELSEQMPERSDTWVNRRLQFTHGYGLVMSPVAQEGKRGDPRLVIKDLPPATDMGLTVDQPAIYFGEQNADYKIVNTDVQELDFPKGDENVYTNYAGTGGVSINNLFERLLFAWQFGDINILLTNYIKDDSKILFWKRTSERVRKIAPFLNLEDDPYLTLSDGKLYWIQDAYTTSPHYPYSEPWNGQYNYIRNSVKVVVDAYNGTVDFYVADEDDPILNVYRDIFPDMFKSLDQMPSSLQRHLRYPVHLFKVLIDKYNTYHMTTPQVFYNNEDLWTPPNEKYGGQQIRMEPYYILSSLPGEEQLQYLLFSPITPQNRDNMIAWITAKSDIPNYGEVEVFKLPKERLILGPAQIEAKIDQDTEISRQLSLWDQRGSMVIRGNLMVIPIEDSFLYVEPVFLIAEGVDIPQLQRVIATAGEEVVMEPTLTEAIRVLFDVEPETTPVPAIAAADTTATPALGQPGVTSQQLEEVRTLWSEAQQAVRNGDWQLFGEKMNRIKEILGRK